MLLCVLAMSLLQMAAQQKISMKNVKGNNVIAIEKLIICSNSQNPYDSTGMKHNWYLQKFFSNENFKEMQRDFKAGVLTKENYLIRFFDKSCKPWNPMCNGTPPYNPFPDDVTMLFSRSFEDVAAHTPTKYLKPSGYLLKSLHQLNTIFSEIDQLQITQSNINNIINLENSISDNKKMDKRELVIFLCAASTARYTLAFWQDFLTGKLKDCIPVKELGSLLREGGGYGHADVSGAVAGAITGGAVADGGGALIGSLVGGVAASVGEMAADLWDYITGKVVITPVENEIEIEKAKKDLSRIFGKLQVSNSTLQVRDICWKCLLDFFNSLIDATIIH